MGAEFVYLLEIWLLLVLCPLSSAETDKCVASFPSGTAVPNDELMNALYLADPQTGYMRFDKIFGWKMTMEASMVDSNINYNEWLAQSHDARIEFVNLWSHLGRMMISGMHEAFGHAYVTDQKGSNKPHGVIDFIGLAGGFYTGCTNDIPDKWPYKCFSRDFFCRFENAVTAIKQTVMDSNFYFENGKPVFEQYVVDHLKIEGMSGLTVDRTSRSSAIYRLFDDYILKFIPEKIQNGLFYQSPIIWNALVALTEGTNVFREWTTNNIVGFGQLDRFHSGLCTTYEKTAAGEKFFCKTKNFTQKIKNCGDLADATPCIYDNLIQNHFIHGKFQAMGELTFIKNTYAKTTEVLTDFKNKALASDRNGLVNLFNKFDPFITVPDSMCTTDWHNAFNCTNNSGCDLSGEQFDCDGGYNCRINMLYRFDCMMKFILNSSKLLIDASAVDRWTSETVTKAKYDLLTWLSYIPMARFSSLSSTDINSVVMFIQRKVNGLVVSYDIEGLRSFISTLPPLLAAPQWAADVLCQRESISTEYNIYCNLDPLFKSIHLFLEAFDNSANSNTRVLSPDVNYVAFLEQLQLDSAKNHINLQTQNLFNDITSQLQDNFASLSKYFSTLANFDKTKADSDIGYISSRLDLFKERIDPLLNSVQDKFSVIFDFALGINIAELSQRAAAVGIAAAQVANPASTLLGGSSIMDLFDTINELAQAGVTTAIVATLGDKTFPNLVKKAKALGEGFAENSEQLSTTKDLIDQLKNKADAIDTAMKFLGKYDSYSPAVLLSDITSYGALFEIASEQLCEAAFSSGTAVAALGEIGLASTGDCTTINADIAELITLYEEFYDYQFDLMDALSDAARGYLAYRKANDLKLLYESGPRVNNAFLQYTALNTFMVSTLNLWEVVTEYCDILTYTRGGAVPDKCERAMKSPSQDAVSEVISYRPSPLCHGNNEITAYRTIPTSPAYSGDTAYIDLDKLYNRETVTFKIPNFQWLKDNGWIGNHEVEKAMYINRFEIFLPPMAGYQSHKIEVSVQPSMDNYLKYPGTKYLIPVGDYSTIYNENSHNCYFDKIDNPYALCRPEDLSKLCIESNGYVERDIQPSIFNEWKVTAKAIPENQVAPQAVTNFNLQVGITMCVVDLAVSKKKREIPSIGNKVIKRNNKISKRDSQHCCGSTQYWSGSSCSNCPSGSVQKLKGYYCQ